MVQRTALRLDLATDDTAYRRRLYEAFYGDVDPVLADAATGLLTPDGPIVTLDASRSPFLSMPNEVADIITPLG